MKNLLLLAWLLLLLPFVHARDCLDSKDCEDVRVSLDERLDDRFRIPSGSYIQQRCADDLHCIQSNFSYNSELDELRFFTQWFELNMSPSFGFLGTTHPYAHIRYSGTHGRETRILSGHGAVTENERTLVEQWIMKPENHFQQSCSNIRYYPSADILTADCTGIEVYERYFHHHHHHHHHLESIPKVISNTAIPYVSQPTIKYTTRFL